MTKEELIILSLEGEILLAEESLRIKQEQLDFFAAEQDFWRRKYLKDHPEYDNWDYIESVREEDI